MEVSQVQGFELVDEVCELGDWVFHSHSLECGPGGKTDTSAFGTNSIDDSSGDGRSEARTVFDATAPLIRAFVACVLGELVDEVSSLHH